MIKFSKEQMATQLAIASRASAMAEKHGIDYSIRTALMDIGAVNANVPLQLTNLLQADDSDFAHDLFGIRRHLNRQTGEVEDCFVPRYAK